MASNHLPTYFQEYIHLSRYSRWIPELNRRETWPETVKRYFDFFQDHLLSNHSHDISPYRHELEEAVLSLKVMPSMRCLMTAGEALRLENMAGYNCSFIAVDSPRAFDEILYVLMNGTGVGFSVEQRFTDQLPSVADDFHESDTTIVVSDSRAGWAKSLKELIQLLYSGQIPKWNTDKVRPAGSQLRTFGGRASGPDPLVDLFRFSVELFKKAAGRRLTTLECHDLVCKIAEVIVVGGVRRSALISLSDLYDDRLRSAKSGEWWKVSKQRSLANNSAVYNEIPDIGIFMDEWKALYDSKSGERGIFSRLSATKSMEESGRRDPYHEWGVNPCGEILLRPKQTCNLTEAIVRYTDTVDDIAQKIKWASILGTWQSTLTKFKYVSKKWKENCEEERLLGVSLTGIMDSPLTSGFEKGLSERLENWKKIAIQTNEELAKELQINPSSAVTCIKPSGTVSSLVNSSAGIHPRWSKYYMRSVRADHKDPLCELLRANGFKSEDDVVNGSSVQVFYFPIETMGQAVFRNDVSAIEQLELWIQYKKHWTEHNPSITVYVKEDEWLEVGAWVYRNFEHMTGVSFLPHSDHVYKQAPYEEITEKRHREEVAKLPESVDWSKLSDFEKSDNTTSSQELSCQAGSCEIL